jgi:hypothetical protein
MPTLGIIATFLLGFFIGAWVRKYYRDKEITKVIAELTPQGLKSLHEYCQARSNKQTFQDNFK